MVVGYLPERVLDDKDVAALVPMGDEISISDYLLRHGHRAIKEAHHTALSVEILAGLPDHIDGARWFYDDRHKNVMAVFDIGVAGKLGKAAVEFNYLRKGQARNAVITTGVISSTDINGFREIK